MPRYTAEQAGGGSSMGETVDPMWMVFDDQDPNRPICVCALAIDAKTNKANAEKIAVALNISQDFGKRG